MFPEEVNEQKNEEVKILNDFMKFWWAILSS